MGQSEIIKVLANERKFSDEFLSAKEIHKALKNMGTIYRLENVYINLRKIKKQNIIEEKYSKHKVKRYRITDKYTSLEI